MELQFKEMQYSCTAGGLSLVQNQFCNKRKMHGVYVCKLLNVFWLHFEELGILEHSEKLSVLL